MFQRPVVQSSSSLSSQQESSSSLVSHADDVETVVGPSVHVEGDFSSEGNILVKGMVSGNVKTSRLLTVESGARITANVKAANAIISGEIKGNVRVSDRLELTETARISGDIVCKVFAVEPGALIVGKVTMEGIAASSPHDIRRPARARRRVSKGDDMSQEDDDASFAAEEDDMSAV